MFKHLRLRTLPSFRCILAGVVCASLVLQPAAPALAYAGGPTPPGPDGPGVPPPDPASLTERVYLPAIPLASAAPTPTPTPELPPEGELLAGALADEPTSPLGVETIVDDWDSGFTHDSTPYWWDQNRYGHPGGPFPTCSGYGNDAHWTYAQITNRPDESWGRWTPTLPEPGRYHVYAYLPWVNTRANDTVRARYRVFHRNGVTERVIQQEHAWCHWLDLGEYPFDAGVNADSGSVYLGDNTGGESPRRTIIFDAVKFVLVAPAYPAPAATPPPPVSFNDPPRPLPLAVTERTQEYINRRSWDVDGPNETLRVGQVIPIAFHIINDGDLPWYKSANASHNPVYLGTSPSDFGGRDHNSPLHDPNDNRWVNAQRIKLVQDVVQPGQEATFEFNLLTHATGNHVECFELVADAVTPSLPYGWFGAQVCWRIEVRADTQPKPELTTHLNLTPATPVENQPVSAAFTVCNHGETTATLGNLLVKVWRNGDDEPDDFPQQPVSPLHAGQCATYDQTGTVGWQAGSYQAAAGYDDGSWHELPGTEGVGNRQDFNVQTQANVTIADGIRLTLDPNTVWQSGQAVIASFTAKNTGEATTTERLRAILRSAGGQGPDFDPTGDLEFAGGAQHTYTKSRTFPDRGVFWVAAQHLPQSSGWTDLIGEGREVLRVFAPAPLEKVEHKGIVEESGYAGEPVNTGSGNFVSRHRDLLAPAPSLPFVVDRTYNAVDANAIPDGAFGVGWTWNYDMIVTWQPDKTAAVAGEDGHVEYYVGDVLSEDPFRIEGRYVYSGTLSEANQLDRQPDGSFVLTSTNQLVYRFAAEDPAAPAGVEWWRLSSIADAQGQVLTIQRDDSARVTSITDGLGRVHTVARNVSGRIAAITAADGRTATYGYDAAGNLTTFIDPEGGALHYTYDGNHRLLTGVDGEGNYFVENTYDSAGRVVTQTTGRGQTVVHSADGAPSQHLPEDGFTSSFAYETADQYLDHKASNAKVTALLRQLNVDTVTTYTDPLNRDTTHFHDPQQRLVMTTDPLDQPVVYTYDASNNVASETDRSGNTTTYTYDERGNRTTKADALGNAWRYTYDERNNRLSETDPLGNTTLYDYDADNRLIRVADPLGFTRVYAYNATGLRIAEWDEDGNETTTAYNALGLPTVITESINLGGGQTALAITRKTYDDRGNLLSITDPEGRSASYAYDDLDRLIRSVDPMGTVTTYTYDATGNLIAETDGMGHVKQRTFNASGWLVGETDFAGNLYQFEYDALGRRIAEIDPLGQTITRTYDIAGNVVAQKDKRGFVTRYAYDANGQVVQETDPLGAITTHTYDALNRRIATTRPCPCGSGVVTQRWVYDAAGHLIEEIDPAGNVTRHTYDAKGQRAATTDALGKTTRFAYDRAGRLVHVDDPADNRTSYGYDAMGRRIKTYDRLGNLVQDQYDLVGNRTIHTDANGKRTRYEYDANDRVIRTFDPLDQRTSLAYDPKGRLTSQVDPRGYTTRQAYDANGNRISLTDARNHTWTYEYDALNRQVKETDPLQHVARLVYDAAGNVIQRIDKRGYNSYFTYDALGRVTEQRDARGNRTRFVYNMAGMLIQETDALGNTTRHTYDANGNRVATTDALGNVTTTEYDALNRPLRIVDALGGVTTIEYDALGQEIARRLPSGAITRFTYDAEGRVLATRDALGHFTSTVYDAAGRCKYAFDPNRNTAAFLYDAAGREIAQTDALGHTMQTGYDENGNVTTTTDYLGRTTSQGYDAANNLVQRIDPAGGVTAFAYNILNRKVSETDAEGRTTTSAYDAEGNLIGQTLPGGQTTSYQVDGNGNRIALVDAEGHTWSYEYDALNRLTAEANPLGQRTETEYDALGRRALVRNALGYETRFGYDALGRLVRVTDAVGRVTRYLYDAAGNLSAHYDPAGNATRFGYDLLGRKVREVNPLGHTWLTQYDPAGNEIARINPAGQMISTTVDALNRPVRVAYPDAQVGFAYDANGNRTVMTDTLGVTIYTYDALNRLATSTDAAGQVVSFAYDRTSLRTGVTYPSGATVTYGYDSNGWLQRVTDAAGSTVYTRNGLGAVTAIAYPNGAGVTSTYDAAGRLVAHANTRAGGQVFAGYTFQLDVAGNRTQVTESLAGTSSTRTYTYDALGRLAASVASDGTAHHYLFDAAGSIQQVYGTRRGDGGQLEAYTIDNSTNAAGQLLSSVDSGRGATSYTYNRAGNRTGHANAGQLRVYTFDAANRLRQSEVYVPNGSGGWGYAGDQYETYTYDGDGRRVRKAVLSSDIATQWQRSYRYDDTRQWDVLVETGAPGAPNASARYTYGDGRDKLAVVDGSGVYAFHLDGLGSVVAYTDPTGAPASIEVASYGDYGQVLGGSAALRTAWTYTGHEQDGYTGLVYAKNRFYDPETAQWLSADPFPGQPDSPLTLQRYLYVQANPINAIDPLGLFDLATGTIERGDTLSAIARLLGVSLQDLLAANRQISNPNIIYPGQHVNTPPTRSAKSETQRQSAQAKANGVQGSQCGERCGQVYVVRTGDTLSSIAAQHGIDDWRDDLYQPNRTIIGSDPSRLKAGQLLSLPCDSTSRLVSSSTTPSPRNSIIGTANGAVLSAFTSAVPNPVPVPTPTPSQNRLSEEPNPFDSFERDTTLLETFVELTKAYNVQEITTKGGSNYVRIKPGSFLARGSAKVFKGMSNVLAFVGVASTAVSQYYEDSARSDLNDIQKAGRYALSWTSGVGIAFAGMLAAAAVGAVVGASAPVWVPVAAAAAGGIAAGWAWNKVKSPVFSWLGFE